MKARRFVAAVLGLALAAPVSVAAQTAPESATAAPHYITYTEEVPCPSVEATHRRRPLARRRARPAHRHRPAHPSARPKPRAKLHRTALVRRHRPQHRPLVRASDPVRTRRCSVVRRDRLTAASFGLTPETAVLTPVSDDVEPGGVETAQPSSGRAAFGQPIDPSTGGGGGVGGGVATVAAAPEPDVWALMLVGVGLLGYVLRRNARGGSRQLSTETGSKVIST